MGNNNLIEENINFKHQEMNIFEVEDVMSDGIYLSDKNGIVISVNKSYTKITGIQSKDIIGKDMQTFLNKWYLSDEYVVIQDEDFNAMNIKEMENEGEPYIIEKPLRKYKSSRKAAKALGVTQPTVLRKAKALGIKEW